LFGATTVIDALSQARWLWYPPSPCGTRVTVTRDRKASAVGYTLGQAARAADVSKTTIQRAIKSGRLSASRQEDGSYVIDPAELHRAFPTVSRDRDSDGEMKQSVTVNAAGELRVEIEMLREQVAMLKDERDDLRAERDRLLGIVETQAQQAKQISDQRPAKKRRWWRPVG
jgi:chromosome segregation ATPase